MKMLIIATNYPSPIVGIGLMYIHTRNLYYIKNGIDVTVLNFSTQESYKWDGIPVISLQEYYEKSKQYDILVSHAPNLRNHYRFIQKNEKAFRHIVFFFHGHEVLYRSKAYSKPYPYMKQNAIRTLADNLYDSFKLQVWHKYLPKLADKSSYVFVSKWMLDEFKKWVKLDEDQLLNHITITYNSIGESFETLKYDRSSEKKYDFVTIRGYLDGSKYAVDIVCRLAEACPQYKFLLIGKGKFFDYHEKPDNLIWKEEYCSHEQIIIYLNESKCALMPTRTDAQGLMACEMATFGIPVITSDIPVCHEIFDDFKNVRFIQNENPDDGFAGKYNELCREDRGTGINRKYFAEETVKKELELFRSLEAGV